MEIDAGALDDIAPGTMRAVELDGTPVLLVRLGPGVHALSGLCPHAGAKLAEGVLCRGEVICPWHKSAFDVATGACTAPPAFDDLKRFPARVADGRVLVTLRDSRVFAIIGTGAAGAAAAQALRAAGFAGRVLLIGRENRLPYDRTLVSKLVLSGERGGAKSPLQEAAFYAAAHIERLVRTVRSIDTTARVIACVDGDDIGYDRAFVATGARARRLQVPGGELAGVLTLRGPEDVMAILIAATRGNRAVVVGGGFIALEVAAALRERGLDVVVTTQAAEPLAAELGERLGAAMRRLHEDQAVRFRCGAAVERLEGGEAVTCAVLSDGSRIDADFVVVAIGFAPDTAILDPSLARTPDGGVVVDPTLCATPGLYAGGDIAAFPLYGGGPPVRLEQWRVAAQHGRLAASNMLGAAQRFEAVPVFWSTAFGRRIDVVGHAPHWDEIVFDGALEAPLGETPSFLAVYVAAGFVAAVAGMGRDRAMAACVGLLTGRRDWTASALLETLSSA